MSPTTENTKPGWSRAPFLAATLLVAAVMIGGCAMSKDEPGGVGSGGAKPASTGAAPPMVASVPQKLEEFRGKVIVLDLWATWCPPCRMEIPGFVRLQNKYRDQGVEVIGIALDPVDARGGGGAAAVGPFMQQFSINYTIWMVSRWDALGKYQLGQGYPTTYIIDRGGNVVKKYVGMQPENRFEDDIKELL
ncbi:MAG TPA: TlpA disulfide reductase family protein [Blastocatellia bacterium]|nr:TlpA disulfide reductase family protein [Blastocatellia bacterium]